MKQGGVLKRKNDLYKRGCQLKQMGLGKLTQVREGGGGGKVNGGGEMHAVRVTEKGREENDGSSTAE